MILLEKYSTPLIGVVGLFIGWFLTQLSQWYKGRKEDNRIRKEVLFYLLELKYDLEKLNFNKQLDITVDTVIKVLPKELQTLEVKAEMKNLAYPLLLPVIKNAIGSAHNLTNESLKAAINKLSSVSPYLAYRLTAFTDIMVRLESGRKVIATLAEDPTMKESPIDLEQFISPFIEKTVFQDNQDDLKKVLRRLALRISVLCYLAQLSWEKRNAENRAKADYQEDLEALMRKALAPIQVDKMVKQ